MELFDELTRDEFHIFFKIFFDFELVPWGEPCASFRNAASFSKSNSTSSIIESSSSKLSNARWRIEPPILDPRSFKPRLSVSFGLRDTALVILSLKLRFFFSEVSGLRDSRPEVGTNFSPET